MYKNLLEEIAKAGISHSDLAKLLNISVEELIYKLAGKRPFHLDECLKIRSVVREGCLGLEYLFEIESDNCNAKS